MQEYMPEEIAEMPGLRESHVTVTKEGRALFTMEDMTPINSTVFGDSKHCDVICHFILYDKKIYVAAGELAASTGRKTTAGCICTVNYNVPRTRKFAVAATYRGKETQLSPTNTGKYRSLIARSIAFVELKDIKTFLEKQSVHFRRLRDWETEVVPVILNRLKAHNNKTVASIDWRAAAYIGPDSTFLGMKKGNRPNPVEMRVIRELQEAGWTPESEPVNLYRNDLRPRSVSVKPNNPAAPKKAEQKVKEDTQREEVTIVVPRGTIVHIRYES